MGPVYCETFLSAGGAIAEPVNTLTNAAAFIAALVGVWLLRTRGSRSLPAVLLILALLANSISSGLWHGLRTEWALSLDVWTGIAAFLVIVYGWFSVLGRRLYGLFGVGGILLAQSAIFSFAPGFTVAILSTFGLVAVVGGILSIWTLRRCGRRAFLLGLAALGLAATAAFFRMIDGGVCSFIPIGTHFLWHILLASAAFAGLLLILETDKVVCDRRENKAAKLSDDMRS